MQKLILSVAFFFLFAVAALAGKDVKVKSGDVSVLAQKAAVQCVVELEGATWEEDESFKDHCGEDYDLRVKLIRDSWPTFFAQYSKGLYVSDDAPAYKAVLKLTKFEKSLFKSQWGKIGVEFYGEIEIIDNATGQAVLVIALNGKAGKPDYVENDRYPKTMKAVCDDMFDLL